MKDIRQNWKALAADRKIQSRDILALCLYRSIYKGEGKAEAISRIEKSFKPVTNTIKLDNGAYPYYSLMVAQGGLKGSIVLTWLDEEDRPAILALAKEIKTHGKTLT